METVDQFIARTSAGTGSIDLLTTPVATSLMGCLRKNKTSNPRSLGAAAFLTNSSGVEYRITNFAYVLDAQGLAPDESAQSDNGFTILKAGQSVALNSGEEDLITHRDDTAGADRGIAEVSIPAGGLALPPGNRLSVGSVSSIFSLGGGEAKIVDDTRLAGGTFMRMCYQADLVRADTMINPAIASYRSPYRDLSFVTNPARQQAPYTDFKNNSDHSVKIYGISIFYSTSTVNQPSNQRVDVYVDGTISRSIDLPSRQPGKPTEVAPLLFPLSLELKPGQVISMRGKVTSNVAIVFDMASYLFADPGLAPINEQLDAIDIDLNGDGYSDIVDVDERGSIRVALRVADGLQDTQQEWTGAIGRSLVLTALPRQSATQPLYLRAANPAGLCLNLLADPAHARFILDYCKVNGDPSLASDTWGDFNGDGWIDRLRVDPSTSTYLVALGGINGLGPATPWIYGYGPVARMFVSDANMDGRDDFEAEWADITGFRCLIWISTGSAFNQTPCR